MIQTNDAILTTTESKFKMTVDRKARVFGEIQECQRLIDKEMRYSPDLRKMDVVNGYEAHKARLVRYLDQAEVGGWFTIEKVA